MQFTKNILALTCIGALYALPAYIRADEPSPTPSPSASPSPTPRGDDDHGGGLSLHGLYEGTTTIDPIAVFYIEGNTHIQVNVLDVAGQSIGFAEGLMTHGSFAFTLSNGQSITGKSGEHMITGTVGGATFQAIRASEFGGDNNVAGRFVGVANGPTGESRVMFVIDRSRHIVMLQNSGTPPNVVRAGGVGTVTAPIAPSTAYTFTLDRTIGSSSPISGSFTIVDGVF